MNPHLQDSIDLLDSLIGYPTVSSDSNLDMIADLANRLESSGARVDLFADATGNKANLVASVGPDAPGGIVLSGHTDVVPVTGQDWSFDPFRMHHDQGRLYGRGACDMKGFIAAAVAKATALDTDDLHRPLHLVLTYDEEVGCLGARALIPELERRDMRPAMVIIGEPTSMQVVEGHKGCCEYTVRFCGTDGHGSAPERGVNAVEYAVRYVNALLALRGELMLRAPEKSRFEPPWTTLNIGRISGGVAHNVIAGKAEVEWEMRPVQPGDAEFVKSALARTVAEDLLPMMQAIHPEADIVTEIIGEVAGFEVMPNNRARDLVQGLLGVQDSHVVPFGTEAGLFQSLGASVVVCGPGSIDQAHKPDEFVALDQISACLDMLDGLIETATRKPVDQDAAFSRS